MRHPLHSAASLLRRRLWVACAVWACSALATDVVAQTAPAPVQIDDPLSLQPSRALDPALTPEQRKNAPVFLQGDSMTGRTDQDAVLQGNAELRKADTVLRADRLEYDQASDVAKAIGNVRLNRGGNVYEGPRMELKLETFEGFFEQPRYQFPQNEGHGEASRAEFIDAAHTVVYDATYTTCRRVPGPSWMPDWILRAATIRLDNDEDVGVAEGAYLSFKGVPLLPVPAISFPLSEKRKSGLLPVSLGIDNVNGSEITAPYYWNIAPNRDATFSPMLMTNRGVDVGAQFRYLEPRFQGDVLLHYMPNDALRSADRWSLGWAHSATVRTGINALEPVGVSLNINRVSDNDYWRDFTRSSSSVTQRLLPADAQARWSSGDTSGTVHVLRWQTLQDVTAPIVPPYDRLPQLTLRHAPQNRAGLDWSVDADFTQFEADRARTLQPNAQRSFALLQISRPGWRPQGFFTPKLQLHASTYQFDALLADGSRSATRVIPTVSLDSGLVFERETRWGAQDMVQTLEPRAFYVYTPYRDQSHLPNYDTAVNDFNFASIYTENAFAGHDKIADNHLVTLGLTTRFLDAPTGAQLARFGVAQRLRFDDQRVTIDPNTPPSLAGISDVLLGATVNPSAQWAVDSTVQYNPKTDQSERATVGLRYQPGPYRILNLAYRYQRESSEQLDTSWQWPINDLWGDRGQNLGAGRGQGEGRYYAVGRLNYSINEQRMVDSVLGVEYDAGCWLGRVVISRTQTSSVTATQRIMFQLEFVGFTRLGIDPRSTLTQSIARYQNLRDPGSAGSGSRFSNYD